MAKEHSVKPTPTLNGYSAWVIQRLTEIKGETPSDIAKYILDRWADDNQEWLRAFGLTREEFVESRRDMASVIDHPTMNGTTRKSDR